MILVDKQWFKSNNFVFAVSYSFFFVSYFLLDIEQETYDFGTVSSLIRYLSLLFGCVGILILNKLNMASILSFFTVLSFGAFSFATTHTTFFLGLGILCLYAMNINNKDIIDISLRMLIALTTVVILLQLGGVLENVQTMRWANSREAVRNSFGFYHSNVLPLIFMYITAYLVALKNDSINAISLYVIMAIALFLYFECNSRNAFLSTEAICVVVILKKKKCGITNKVEKIIAFCSKYMIAFCSTMSILGALLYNISDLLKKYDYYFSNRFKSSYRMIEKYGLHLIAHINRIEYSENAAIIDNGYLLVSIRFGLLYVVLLCLLGHFLGRKIQSNFYSCVVFTIIALANFIDNDLFDYSCLPFLLIAIKSIFIKDNQQINILHHVKNMLNKT